MMETFALFAIHLNIFSLKHFRTTFSVVKSAMLVYK